MHRARAFPVKALFVRAVPRHLRATFEALQVLPFDLHKSASQQALRGGVHQVKGNQKAALV